MIADSHAMAMANEKHPMFSGLGHYGFANRIKSISLIFPKVPRLPIGMYRPPPVQWELIAELVAQNAESSYEDIASMAVCQWTNRCVCVCDSYHVWTTWGDLCTAVPPAMPTISSRRLTLAWVRLSHQDGRRLFRTTQSCQPTLIPRVHTGG